jgi:hypothetical protein
MSQVILEFPLERECAVLHADSIAVELGNGVRLTTSMPAWVKGVNKVTLQLVLEVEGSPHANSEPTPIVGVYETPTDR